MPSGAGGGRGESGADGGGDLGAEDFDGAEHFGMREGGDAHLKSEAGDAAEGFVDVENFFGDGFGVADQ